MNEKPCGICEACSLGEERHCTSLVPSSVRAITDYGLSNFLAGLRDLCERNNIEISGVFALHGDTQSLINARNMSKNGLEEWKRVRVIPREEAEKL